MLHSDRFSSSKCLEEPNGNSSYDFDRNAVNQMRSPCRDVGGCRIFRGRFGKSQSGDNALVSNQPERGSKQQTTTENSSRQGFSNSAVHRSTSCSHCIMDEISSILAFPPRPFVAMNGSTPPRYGGKFCTEYQTGRSQSDRDCIALDMKRLNPAALGLSCGLHTA